MSITRTSVVACINCEEIGEFIQDFSSGDFVCSNCGAVQPGTIIDSGKEWRDFDNDDHGEDRIRAERVDEDFHSLGTEVSGGVSNRALSRYSRIASSSNDKTEQHLKQSFKKLNDLVELLQIPNLIRQNAKEILKIFEKKKQKNMKGYRKDAFLVAVLLSACRQEQGGYTIKGLAKATNIEEREIKRFYKYLIRDSEIHNFLHQPHRVKEIGAQVSDLVQVFCNRLALPFSVTKEAQQVAKIAMDFLEGKRPASIAAASLVFVLQMLRIEHRQQDISIVSSVSLNTLRNVLKDFTENIHKLPSHLFTLPNFPISEI